MRADGWEYSRIYVHSFKGKQNMKLSTLLIAALAAIGLAACGEEPKPAPKPAPKVEAPAPAPAPAPEVKPDTTAPAAAPAPAAPAPEEKKDEKK